MKLYQTIQGVLLNHNEQYALLEEDMDPLINRDGLFQHLSSIIKYGKQLNKAQAETLTGDTVLPPIGTQEVWAAGVTYMRSRDARMEESKRSGAAVFYDKVYEAERPELFFKSTSKRVRGHNDVLFIRSDSGWNVPEPELTLFINSFGNIQGYTIGNDMSSRSIEGENPLYLPQAKVYDGSAALGPCLYVPQSPIPMDTMIHLEIRRKGSVAFTDEVAISRMRRSFDELAFWLYRELDFEKGCFLMTGTCLVPPDDFTLEENDLVTISIDHIGTLANTIKSRPERKNVKIKTAGNIKKN